MGVISFEPEVQQTDAERWREAAEKLREALDSWATGGYQRSDIWRITNAARAAHDAVKG